MLIVDHLGLNQGTPQSPPGSFAKEYLVCIKIDEETLPMALRTQVMTAEPVALVWFSKLGWLNLVWFGLVGYVWFGFVC